MVVAVGLYLRVRVPGDLPAGRGLGAGLAPLVAQRLVTDSAGTTHLAWYIVGAYVVSGIAVLLSRNIADRRREVAEPRQQPADVVA